jgi:histidinol-phosphate aminotransferase
MRDGLGPQGGQGGSGLLDLSSCLNPYGPAPRALDALRDIDPVVLSHHPFTAEDDFKQAYGSFLGADPDLLTVDRGVSGLIWRLAAAVDDGDVALPLPTYTEFVRAFPGALRVAGGSGVLGAAGESAARTVAHSADQLERAMRAKPVCIFSNPHNPSGTVLPASVVSAVAAAVPFSTLVVDESYMDFQGSARSVHVSGSVGGESLIGTPLPNVVVLRSPTKFFGLGGARVGAAWTRDRLWADRLADGRGTWPLSPLDVHVTIAALADQAWAMHVRRRLSEDGRRLVDVLTAAGCELGGSKLHFSLVVSDPNQIRRALADAEIVVRDLGPAHGVGAGSFRLRAPASEAGWMHLAEALTAAAAR